MLYTKIPHLKLNIGTKPKTAALVVYEETELLKDDNFLIYVENLFKEFGVESFISRLYVLANKSSYISNSIFLRKYYWHPQNNHIVVFEGTELVKYMTVDELEKIYIKTVNKIESI